ncbi:MAG: family 78 glycoside hydrolase catalytic domain, partial [Clostridia bacterium]|nr:family 78 glycoside hydrolase catalytic domain [Clostridia bacterium]
MKNARWIWADVPSEVNQYVCFESEFELRDLNEVTARICTSGEYALYINGQMAGFGQFSSWPHKPVFNEHDISEYCINGKNRFELAVWHMGIDCSVAVATDGRACFEVVQGACALLASNEGILCCVDERYVCGPSVPLVTGQLGFSFEYDARIAKGGLHSARAVSGPESIAPRKVPLLIMEKMRQGVPCFQGYFTDAADAEDRPSARMMNSALSYLLPENMVDKEGWHVSENGDGICIIFDLGRESSGYYSMGIELEENSDILIGWGEHLKDMRVRTFIDGRNFCAVYHGKKGMNSFMHPFRRMGCRYIQLHICAN